VLLENIELIAVYVSRIFVTAVPRSTKRDPRLPIALLRRAGSIRQPLDMKNGLVSRIEIYLSAFCLAEVVLDGEFIEPQT
jgi:hypothetical protein